MAYYINKAERQKRVLLNGGTASTHSIPVTARSGFSGFIFALRASTLYVCGTESWGLNTVTTEQRSALVTAPFFLP